MSELTLTHQATGSEHVGEGLKGRATSYIGERVTTIEKSDNFSDVEKKLARMALEWTQGRNQDPIAAAEAWRMVRDQVDYANAFRQPIDSGLEQVVTDLRPYFVTSYRIS